MNKFGVYNKFADLVDAWIALGFLQLVLTKPVAHGTHGQKRSQI